MTRRVGGLEGDGERATAASAPNRIVWLRLRLQGIGRHRDTTFRFPDGLVTTIAGNERGKSTAVLGLIATVWGVPHGGERQGFTWARLRASSGAPHRGEVEFRRGDVRYLIERDFETHRVRVVRDDGAPLQIIDAEHNPQARRGHGVVPAWLRATFGIDDAALVFATFVWAGENLAGPGDRIGPAVQALMAGAGGGTAHEAIERLEQALRRLTRHVRGLTPGLQRDGRGEQLLETIQERRRELLERWRDGLTQLDERARARRAADLAEAAAEDALQARARLHAQVAAQRGGRVLAATHAEAVARARDAERALRVARELAAVHAAAVAAAAAASPELAGVAEAGFDDRLAAWVAAEEAVARQQERVAAATETRTRILAAAQARVAESIVMRRWDEGGDPWAEWRDAVLASERWRAALAAFAVAHREVEAIEDALAAHAPLAGLPDADRADLPRHRADLTAVAERWTAARAEADALAARVAEAELRYGPVADLDPETIADLHAFVRAEDHPRAGSAGAAVAGVAIAAAVAAAGVMGWGPTWPVIAGAAASGVVAFLAWPRGVALRRARRRLAARAAAGVDALAGGEDRYRELWRRREAYEVRRDEVQRLRADAAAADARLAAAASAAASFRERWEPLRRALLAAGHPEDVDLGAAWAERERLLAAFATAVAARDAAARAVAVDEPTALLPDAPAAAAGRDAALLLAWAVARGALPTTATVAALTAWCAACSEATWRSWGEAAAEASRARAEAEDAQARLEADVTRVAREQERAVVAEEQALAAARERLLAARAATLSGAVGFDPPDAATVRAAARERSLAQVALAAARARLEAHLVALGAPDLAALEAAAAQAAAAMDSAAAALAEVASAGVEGSFDDDAVAAADRAAEEAAARARAAREASARLEGGEAFDPGRVEAELAELDTQIARIALERDARALAARVLTDVARQHRLDHTRALEAIASRALQAFTGVAGRRVLLGADDRAEVVEPDGRVWTAGQLSQGARDQLTLALRFAVAEVLTADAPLPLILDDPFAHWDRRRALGAKQALTALAAEGRQVWLLAHRPELATWGTPAQVEVA